MKKGCFIKSIIILTILTAVVFYIIQNHIDLLIKPGRKIIKSVMFSGLDERLASLKDNSGKDSLLILLDDYFNHKFDSVNTISDNDFDWIESYLDTVISDSIIDNAELKNLNQIINSKKNYERSKKN
ncbi:MAG: hypothetical protein ACM339_05190 [Ignavibacteria bacterium]